MNEVIEFLNQGWVGTTIGILVAIAILILTRQKTAMSYQSTATRLISKRKAALPFASDLAVSYAGEPVPQVTLTRFVLWNSGTTTLKQEAIVADDPLRIEFPTDYRILDAQIAVASRPSIKFRLWRDSTTPNTVRLDFLYLDPQDGARIEILHTGDLSLPKLNGVLQGMPLGPTNLGPFQDFAPITGNTRADQIAFTLGKWFAILGNTAICLFFWGFALFMPYLLEAWPYMNLPMSEQTAVRPIMAVLALVYTGIMFLGFKFRRRFPRRLAEPRDERLDPAQPTPPSDARVETSQIPETETTSVGGPAGSTTIPK